MKPEQIVEEVNKIISEYSTRLTLRQIYYQLVSKHIIENNIGQYKKLSRILVKARHDGDVNWENIEDRTRQASGGDEELGFIICIVIGIIIGIIISALFMVFVIEPSRLANDEICQEHGYDSTTSILSSDNQIRCCSEVFNEIGGWHNQCGYVNTKEAKS